MTMQFWETNDLFTTTQIAVSSGTIGIGYLMDRNPNTTFITDGYGTNTSAVIIFSFTSAVVLDKIFLQNFNLKQFRIFYNSATTNTFTPNIQYTTNSESSMAFSFATTTVSSITLQMDLATTADTEKEVGEIYLGQLRFELERNPTAKAYKPAINRKQVIHTMPNGGISRFIVDEKFKGELSWEYVTGSFYSNLQELFNEGSPFYFVPFPTTSSWDSQAYEVLWTNNFDFDFSSDNQNAGYGGKIVIEETA